MLRSLLHFSVSLFVGLEKREKTGVKKTVLVKTLILFGISVREDFATFGDQCS